MADLTDSTATARPMISDGQTGELLARLSMSELLELDLDGPTLEILLAALTAADCDRVGLLDG